MVAVPRLDDLPSALSVEDQAAWAMVDDGGESDHGPARGRLVKGEGMKALITRGQLAQDLTRLGLEAGDVVMVHASMRAVGAVLGGPDVVIDALLDVVAGAGTLMMYVDWEHGLRHLIRDAAEVVDDALWEELPPFDPQTSRARRKYGIVAEFLRTWPGAVRSGNPNASVAAVGRLAEWICRDHPLRYGYGPGSPLAKLVEAEGKVLLLGSPLGDVTLLHYAEHLARLPNKRVIRYREPVLVDGVRRWVEIEEFDTRGPVVAGAPKDYFTPIVRGFLSAEEERSGRVGHAEAYVLDAAGLCRYAVEWMERHLGG